MINDGSDLLIKFTANKHKKKVNLIFKRFILFLIVFICLFIVFCYERKKIIGNIKLGNSNEVHHYSLGTQNVYVDDDENGAGRFIGIHICLLLDNDIFEYGIEDNKGIKTYSRKKNIGKSKEFDWEQLKVFTGTTNISADELDLIIRKDRGEWTGNTYDVNLHNCQDFIYFCLQKIGCKINLRTYFPSRGDWTS